jgi:xanthine dehydrogenase YagR molybdenum-binding subunit
VSRPETRPEWPAREALRLLNTDLPRVDGPLKVTGRAQYTHDVRLPGMVWARLVCCPYPRARIEELDAAPALAVAGVVWAQALRAAGDEVAYQGYDGVVAAVAALSPEAAEDGARAVRVAYERLYPALVTPEQALERGAPGIGRGGSNVQVEGSRGDRAAAEAALAGCDALVDATYTLPVQHHACLETHGVVVDFRGEEATVWHSSQDVTGGPGEFARHLGLPREKVTVITQHMGGGFGSKFGAGSEGQVACRIARELRRPVHLMLTRRQEFLMAGNRSGSRQRLRGGATRDGKLRALLAQADKHGGMGQGSLPMPPYIYAVEAAWAEVRAITTATDPSRAQRAPGHPQASFAMEGLVDELAYKLGLDPLEFRKANLPDPVWHRQLERVAREVGWFEHPHRSAPGRADGGLALGIGFGVSVWGSGSQPSTVVELRIEPSGAITASTAVQDLGTGSRTLVAAIVAEEFGLPLAAVLAHIGDSRLPPAVFSGGSVTTGSITPSIKDAAHKGREALEERVAPLLGGQPGELSWADGHVQRRDGAGPRLDWTAACAALGNAPLVVQGRFQEHLRGRGVHGAQSARVEVDTSTGALRVLKMACVQDQGLPFNRLGLRSQINGGMIQALSYGLFEQRVHDPDYGLLLTANLEDYRIAGMQECPELVAIIDDEDSRQQAMGMAEAPVIPGHAAIANAVFNACGARVRDLPLTPDRILQALAEGG